VHTRSNRTYKPLAEVWFTIGIADRSAFHLTMANAVMLFAEETGSKGSETTESMMFYTMSLRSVNKRLQDPVDGISEGVIGTVLGFVCHDVGFPVDRPRA
jgi:hypothetical protein